MAAVKFWFPLAISVFLALPAVTAASPGHAAAAEADPSHDAAVAERLAALLARFPTLSARFEQTTTDDRGMVTEQASGYVLVDRPHRFKWVLESPYEQTIVTAGERVYVYDPDLDQVTVQPLQEALADTPVSVLTGEPAALDDHFVVSGVDTDTPGVDEFTLTPRQPGTLFQRLGFRFRAGALDALIIEDHLGHTVRIRFSEVTHPEVVESAAFDFTIPPGADVIGDVRQPG